MLVAARKVETIVEDDELLSSFYASWLEAGGYFSVAIETGENIIQCELNDQSNGFCPRTIRYAMTGGTIKFWVSDDEYFDRANRINEIEILVSDKEFDIDSISSCLKFIFEMADVARKD